MEIENEFTKIASLIGERARALILWSLLDQKAYTASELSIIADISRQSVSNHLSKLIDAKLVCADKQGRHRYFRLTDENIAHVIESMASLIPHKKIEIKKNAKKLSFARTCYDHLAGKISVEIVNALLNKNIICLDKDSFKVTEFGEKWFDEIGINIDNLKSKKRSFAHKCLDWTERKHHIAGALGNAILEKFLEKDFIRKKKNSREILITTVGKKFFYEKLNIIL